MSDPDPEDANMTTESNAVEVIDLVPTIDSMPPESWSSILQSPPDFCAFSPSLEMGNDGNLHGLGLQLATERTKSVGKFGRSIVTYLSDIAGTYDTFGKILVKSSQSIHPDVWKISDSDDNGEEASSPSKDDASASSGGTTKYETTAKSCYESVQGMGLTTTRLADYYRTRLVAPLRSHLSADRTAIDTHGQRYVAARTQCLETRHRALAARTKYVKAIRAVEKAFRKWKTARRSVLPMNNGEEAVEGETTTSVEDPASSSEDVPPWEKTLRHYGKHIPDETEKLLTRIKDAESLKIRYQELVENENDAVEYAQKMEAVALDAIQDVETTMVRFFLESVVQPLCEASTETLEKLPMSSQHRGMDMKPRLGEETSALDLKKGKDLLANIFVRQSVSYEEGMGRTDAETLGLPLVCGHLRDDVKKQVSGIAARIKAAETLTEFLDTFGGAILALHAGLKIDSVPTKSKQEPLYEQASSSIGPTAAEMWKAVVKIYEGEADVAGEFASSLEKLRLEKLEVFLESAQKDLRAEKEFDDSNWKTLCEIARAESKAAARYRQVRAQQEKARERVHSVDMAKGDEASDENGTTQTTPQKNRMSKALFAGGEAMMKFQANARMALAKSNLNEVEQIAVKEQQALDEATTSKTNAIADYKRVTEIRIKKLESINKAVRKDFEKIMEAIMNGLVSLNAARDESLQAPVEGGKVTLEQLMKDVEEWLQTAKDRIEANRKIAAINESEQRENDFGSGFQLTVRLVESETLSNLLALSDPASPLPEFMLQTDGTISAESSDDELEIDVADSFETTGSPRSTRTSSVDAAWDSEDPPVAKGSASMTAVPNLPDEDTIPLKHADSNFEETSDINDRKQKSHDKEVFIRQFWNDRNDSDEMPEILEIISCAYRPKEKAGFLIPALHGRLFTTANKLYFLAWDNKSFVLSCEKIVSVAKEKGFMGASDTTIVVTYNSAADSEAAFVLSRLVASNSVLEHLQKLQQDSKTRNAAPAVETGGDALPTVPEDELLKKMTIVLSKSLRGVSIQQVYEKAWSEGNRTSEKPFYGPWLVEEECFEITVEDWEFAEPGSDGFIGPWDKERYSMRRLCTFKFKRTSHLYIGPPIAFVKQMHYCRVEGNDKCVVCISASMEGIPYSDAFVVEMRWVAIRQGANDLDIKVGLEVDFKKSTMLKSQIRSGTIAETKNVHIRMFNSIKKLCSVPGSEAEERTVAELEMEEENKEEEERIERPSLFSRFRNSFTVIPVNPNFMLFAAATLAYPVVFNFFAALFGAPAISIDQAHRLNVEIQELRREVHELKASLDIAVELLKKRG